MSGGNNNSWPPQPTEIGLPSKFMRWRPNQPQAVVSIIDNPLRFFGLTAPVGSGKSLVAFGAAILDCKRMLYLTSTKGLQAQLLADFAHAGLVDIRGKNNYQCGLDDSLTCDQAPCSAGFRCPLKSECPFWSAVYRAQRAQFVVTNYAFWMSSQSAGISLGHFDMMVADEAHSGDEVVSMFLQASLKRSDFPYHWPGSSASFSGWKDWADHHAPAQAGLVTAMAEAIKDGDWTPYSMKQFVKARQVRDSLDRIASADEEDWILELEGDTVKIGPVWPRNYTEAALWRGIRKILAMSATMNSKTLEMLGISDEDCLLEEYPHRFPLKNRLVTHVNTGVRLNFRTEILEMKKLIRIMDQIVDRRVDRNGLVHTVSYARRDLYLASTRHRELMMTHGRRDAESQVHAFKRRGRREPVILVSPSMTTGYDFPGREAEWQILMKLPYPDTTSKLVKARSEQDKDYPSHVAMMELVQTSGRIVRSEADVGETLIVDDSIGWFMKRFGGMAPRWFREAYVNVAGVPDPPERGGEEWP